MPTRPSASRQRRRASSCGTFSCARIASTICVSMRSTGLSVIIGSWKIIATFRPRIVRHLSSAAPTSSCPLSLMEPATIRPGGSIRPRIERPVTVLPEPDSPTSPITTPRSSETSTPSTAAITPPPGKKWALSSPTSSTAVSVLLLLGFEARVQQVAQPVADQVDGKDRQQQQQTRIDADPVLSGQDVLVAVGDQKPERRFGDRHSDAEERQRRLQRD